MKNFVYAALTVGALAACDPHLVAQTPSPPGRTARLDAVQTFWGIDHYTLTLSQGVAFALTCEHGGPCKDVKATSENAAIADPRRGSLARLAGAHATYANNANDFMNRQTVETTVIVGRSVGTTRVHVKTSDGERMIEVTVVAPPGAPAAAATAAR